MCIRDRYNTLDAISACWNLGVSIEDCADALAKNHGVKGRMEIIPTPGKSFTIGTLLHPSPASPIANKLWPERPIQQLKELGIL